MADHAWCRDPSRDEAVRAAEDGRDRPLPTLEEAIALAFGFDKASAQRACDEVKSWPEDVQKDCRFVLGNLLEQGVERLQALVEAWRYGKGLLAARYPDMIPKSVSASSGVEHENKGNSMRTERITLEVTHDDNDGHIQFRNWDQMLFGEQNGIRFPGESVRVVEEELSDAWAQRLARLTAERDAAIRERESWKLLADRTNERLSAAEARVAELEAAGGGGEDSKEVKNDPTIGQMIEDTCKQLATAMRVADIEKRRGDKLHSRVKELEAASGGGQQKPDAWGVVRDGNVQSVTHRLFRNKAGDIAEKLGGTVVPLYRSPPQPRGWLTNEEREAVQWAADAAYDKQHPAEDTLRNILARSSPPEVDLPISLSPIDEELIRAALAAAGVAVKEVG